MPDGDWTERPRSVSLIDAQYLNAAAAQALPAGTTLNLEDFAGRITPTYHWRFRTYYFDALPYKPVNGPTPAQAATYATKQAELKLVTRLDRFTVREGYCARSKKYGRPVARAGGSEQFECTEQKMVDVLLATELTRIAWSKEAQHISLVAGDADYVPAVQAAKNAGALVRLYYYRGGTTSYGERLFDEADERFDLARILDDIRQGRPDPRRPSLSSPTPPPPAASQ